ncbi:uncharacterized protein LOC106137631 [Amyelois transitella]|uniref:uncharacterized protein LOC106137631 n=1 Tax=Amyelois transitella TaxID=680683 RepID=UPI0029902955|nr:uncharacterized protein LOC106137631 [Amyelois transitella]
MTNKEDICEEICDTRLAALMAVQLVRQVLDEAYVIANAANESGMPWRCLSMVKKLSTESIGVEEEISYATYREDCEDNMNKNDAEDLISTVVTSTPQKVPVEILKIKTDTNLIGQGDEEIDTQENELNNSTATFINHLFDMSDVERVIICDDSEFIPSSNKPCNFPPLQDITKMMESYVNAALSMAFVTETQDTDICVTKESSMSTDYSGYSFLSDAFDIEDAGEELAFVIDDGITDMISATQVITVENVIELQEKPKDDDAPKTTDSIVNVMKKQETVLYEDAYLTLNRDYEQCSEEEDPVLLDPKGLAMQEVELLTAQTSEEDLQSAAEKKCNEMAATSAVSAVSRKSKSSLVSRCRSQGARLLACLRGWWRRKTPGKRKETRFSGSIRDICPLSPDARLRATSMLDQRRLGSPSPNHSVVWKFNTVNEALVNSSRWKEYTFDVKPDECEEL